MSATSIVTPEGIECGGFMFYNNFDSANLAKVELVESNDSSSENGKSSSQKSSTSIAEDSCAIDMEFNLWTKHDCHGTEFQNNNRTWFYFGVKAPSPGLVVKLNVVNLNKQLKMFSQGMSPVYKTIPGHPHWERIRDKPTFHMDHKSNEFTLSFVLRVPDNPKAVVYFAFTYPFTYTDLQNYLKNIDVKMAKINLNGRDDDIYYHRECAIKSLDGRRLELLTISSYRNITNMREARLENMFPDENEGRSYTFENKKVVFVSARVHPGETPSSFVFNGLLNFLLNRDDPIASALRKHYVFKMIPMLNPDGVSRGHYRMDTRGVNLNRVYLNPSPTDHPTIFAARSLIKYYHNSYRLPQENKNEEDSLRKQVTLMSLDEKEQKEQCNANNAEMSSDGVQAQDNMNVLNSRQSSVDDASIEEPSIVNSEDSGLFLYIDLHGHASKKGVFMYGNHFEDPDDTIMCMLLPKLMSINNANFHFTSCNFTEKNMYLVDKRDGMSREGSGRVAVYKMTGLIRSYTLECNYNSGRLVNNVPPRIRDTSSKMFNHSYVPPKYTPVIYEEVGADLGPSILDLANLNPNSRLPSSQYRSLKGVKSYLRLTYLNNITASLRKPIQEEKLGDSMTPREEEKRSEGSLMKRRTASLFAIRKKKALRRPSAKSPTDSSEGASVGSSGSTTVQIKKALPVKRRNVTKPEITCKKREEPSTAKRMKIVKTQSAEIGETSSRSEVIKHLPRNRRIKKPALKVKKQSKIERVKSKKVPAKEET